MNLGYVILLCGLVWLAAVTCMVRNSDDDNRPRHP